MSIIYKKEEILTEKVKFSIDKALTRVYNIICDILPPSGGALAK